MNLDKTTIFNIAIVIHMALTGLALIQLFKLKSTTGAVVIVTFLALLIPILGPSALIVYLQNLNKKKLKENNSTFSSSKKKKK